MPDPVEISFAVAGAKLYGRDDPSHNDFFYTGWLLGSGVTHWVDPDIVGDGDAAQDVWVFTDTRDPFGLYEVSGDTLDGQLNFSGGWDA